MRGIGIKTDWARRQLIVAACVFTGVLAFGAALGQAKIVHVNGQTYGVMYPPGHGATVTPGSSIPTIGLPNQDPLTLGNGPLMLNSKLYLIYWGSSGSFAASYENPITQWAKDLAIASSTNTTEFSVTRQYTNGSGKPITAKIVFGAAVNDTRAFPALSGACRSDPSSNPCITDGQLQSEIKHEISANGWPVDPAGTPEAQYIVLTPNGVDGCIDNSPGDCTYNGGYCGYHGAITPTASTVAIYTALPYVSGCDSGQAPSGVQGNADTDGSLDTLIHEVGESATDPENGAGYTDSSGFEIGDKCDGQTASLSQFGIYGAPLGGSLSASTAFNQLINGHSYYTQTLWSNVSTKTPGGSAAVNGCAQRLGPSPSFTTPSTITTGAAASFNGSGSNTTQNGFTGSYDLAAPITAYTWNFGDGSPALTTTSAKPTHVYDKAGTYTVTLTVADSTGAANRSTRSLAVKVTGSTLVPSISGFSPSSGITGSTVTINGSNLASASKVTFNGLAATISSDAATQIKAVVPNGASTGPIKVTTAGATATSSASFTVTLSVTGFSPTSGAAGTLVTINGVGFNSGSAVKFNGATATAVNHMSSTKLTAVVPTGATTGPITVTNATAPTGTVRSANSYTV
jgi:PKD repeat protein